MSQGKITLRKVEVHNLKQIDLDIPRGKLVVVCGVSGSGKTSLALDTLYAEGQRRYVETFSPAARQHLKQMEKPAAERIDGVPAAVAVSSVQASRSPRATVATSTEIADHVRLLLAKVGDYHCPQCHHPVKADTPQTAAERLASLPEDARFLITFSRPPDVDQLNDLQEEGFIRVILGDRTVNLADESIDERALQDLTRLYVVVDRLTARGADFGRLQDSMETAMAAGGGAAQAWISPPDAAAGATVIELDGRSFGRWSFSRSIRCEECGLDFSFDDPRLYNFNSPLGACPTCQGSGQATEWDLDLCVPDRSKSLRDGAIAVWATKTDAREFDKLISFAERSGIPVDVPVRELSEDHWQAISHGEAGSEYEGLAGFFESLGNRKGAKAKSLVELWSGLRPCPECGGARLRDESLAARIGGRNIAEIGQMRVEQAGDFFEALQIDERRAALAAPMLSQIRVRLRALHDVGLVYLTLDRAMSTLSSGEARRASLAATLGCSLVNVLYVLDEPSTGLHPRDVTGLIDVIERLRDRGNSIVAVEHEPAIILASDELIDIGPGAGEQGGEVVFQGPPNEILDNEDSLTGQFLSKKRGASTPQRRRPANRGKIHLSRARGNNLKNISVNFPLGLLCVVTGVSGAGKSSLVQDTLYPALCRRRGQEAPRPLPFDEVLGDEALDDVLLVDQSPISRSGRSNPATYIKAFDEIRKAFAATVDAKTRNYTASHFSFNVDGGRCQTCQGEGRLQIDMQFLPDVYVPCRECKGKQYRREILDVHYRGRNVADVLAMTVREAFSFFRGQRKVQTRLKHLIDVGLDYIRLGQPASTLSSGESQRLKLAGHLATVSRRRTLFLLDEPTAGLHFADVTTLLDCFHALLSVGHSLIVVEHNLQLLKAADWVIDLGPGAADEGGEVICCGTPEEVAKCPQSATGAYLAEAL